MTAELVEIVLASMPDSDLWLGLDPVLAASMQERLEAQPELRQAFAMAALGRVVGWRDSE